MHCMPPGSSVHVRILEWVAIRSSRRSSWPRDRTCISSIAGWFFTAEPPGKTSKLKCALSPNLRTTLIIDTCLFYYLFWIFVHTGMWFLISRGWLKGRSLYINRTSKKAQSSIMLYFCSDTADALRCLYFHDKGLAIEKAEMLNMMLSSWIKHSDITLNIKCLKKISFF